MKKLFVLLSVLLLSAQYAAADVIPPEISIEIINTKGEIIPRKLYDDFLFKPAEQTNYLIPYYEKDSRKWGLKDKDGNIITPPVYDDFFSGKNDFTVKINDKWGLTDKKGDMLIEPFSEKFLEFKDDYSFAQIENKIGIINKKGEWVINPEWEQTDQRCNRHAVMQENVIVYKNNKNNKYSFINLETLKTSENEYDDLKPFSEGLAYACINEKCGYLNKNEEWKIAPNFEKTLGLYDYDNMSFHEGLAAVQLGKNKQGYIDKKGKIVLKNFYFAGRFSQGLAPVKKTKDGLFGYIDKTGKWAIEPKYETAGMFYGGFTNVTRYLSKSEFVEKYGKGRYYHPKFNAKKRYMKFFSAVLLVLVLIAGISMRQSGKKS